jgi:hypothetical protein
MVMEFRLTFDCADPAVLAPFWAATLGYKPADPREGFATWEEWLRHMEVSEEEWNEGALIEDPDRPGYRITFLQVPEPKMAKNRIHLDLNASDGPTAPIGRRKEQGDRHVDRLLGLGARRLGVFESVDHYHVVMQDPEGNEICVR